MECRTVQEREKDLKKVLEQREQQLAELSTVMQEAEGQVGNG